MGLKKLLCDIEIGVVDMIVCEVFDCLVCDVEDVVFFGKKLMYYWVVFYIVLEGYVDEIKFVVVGLFGVIFFKYFIDKMVCGMEVVVFVGCFVGGCVYGYKCVIKFDVCGEFVCGFLEIDEM